MYERAEKKVTEKKFIDSMDEESIRLDKLRAQHREKPGDDEISARLARCLFNAFNHQTDRNRASALQKELRELYQEQPGNAGAAGALARMLFNIYCDQLWPMKDETLLESLCELHRKQPGNAEVSGILARALYNCIYNQRNRYKVRILVEILYNLYLEQPGNVVVSKMFGSCLMIRRYSIQNPPEIVADISRSCPKKAGPTDAHFSLDAIRKRHKEAPGNEEASLRLAKDLFNAFTQCGKTEHKKAAVLLEELRSLHRRSPGNYDLSFWLGYSLEIAITLFSDLKDSKDSKDSLDLMSLDSKDSKESKDSNDSLDSKDSLDLMSLDSLDLKDLKDSLNESALLEELRDLQGEHPGEAGIAILTALALFHIFDNHAEPEQAGTLFSELRKLHGKLAGDTEDADDFDRLLHVILHQTDPKKAGILLDELRKEHREEPGDIGISEWLAESLVNAVRYFYKSLDVNILLDELRELYRTHPGNDAITNSLAGGLYYASLRIQGTDREKASELMAERRQVRPGLPW